MSPLERPHQTRPSRPRRCRRGGRTPQAWLVWVAFWAVLLLAAAPGLASQSVPVLQPNPPSQSVPVLRANPPGATGPVLQANPPQPAEQAPAVAPAPRAEQPQYEPRRRALLVGVGNFADSAFPDLLYAHNDVESVRKWLVDPKGGGFRPGDVTVLLDRQATRAEILRQAERLAQESRPEDLVFLYFSTHGFYTPDRVLGIVCYDTHATGQTGPQGGPLVYRDQSLTRGDLHQFLLRLPARRQAVVVDVCHSAELAGPPEPSEEQVASAAQAKGVAGMPEPEPQERTTLILASSLSTERAWESKELESSIFTHYILQGLKKYQGDLLAAFNFAKGETDWQARCEKGFCQTPYLIQDPPGASLSLAPPAKE